MYIRYLLALLCATLFFTQPVFSQQPEKNCSGAATSKGYKNIIVFINGILNTENQANCSLQSLRTLVDPEATESDFELFYNPSKNGAQGLVEDTSEMRTQAKISDRATDIAQNDSTILVRGVSTRYNYVLGKLYSDVIENEAYVGAVDKEVYVRTDALYSYLKEQVQNGKSVTVVPHSQGNFYIEAAIAIMRYRSEEDLVSKIKVVGVAPVSSMIPNAVYFSLEEDRALELQRKQTTLLKFYKVLPANARGCLGVSVSATCGQVIKLSALDWMMHSFSQVYLNRFVIVDSISIRDRIRDQVVRSRNISAGGEVPDAPTEEVIVEESQNALGTGDCKAFFWVSGVRKPGLDGRYYLILETHSIDTREFLKSYFVWNIDGKETTTWPASYDNPISAGWHTITLKKYVSKNEVYKYTRKINISMTTSTGQEDCPL